MVLPDDSVAAAIRRKNSNGGALHNKRLSRPGWTSRIMTRRSEAERPREAPEPQAQARRCLGDWAFL